MIKRIVIYFSIIYSVLGFGYFLFSNKFSVKRDLGSFSFTFSVFIILLLIFGLLLGLALAVIFKRPSQERLFYISGQLIVLAVAKGLIMYQQRLDRVEEAHLTNAVKNNQTIALLNVGTPNPHFLLAYDSFRLRFNSPEDFYSNFTLNMIRIR